MSKMEKNTSKSYLDQKPLILNELAQAKELLEQLESALYAPSNTNGKLLIPQILSYFENSLSMLSGINSDEAGGNQSGSETASTGTDSPRSVTNGSPRRDYESDLIGSPSKKRKTVPRWTEQVHVCEQTGLEGPSDDGYSWRKYGQKDILGATYPRGYYRCTHRNSQGCFAMKQVQRSEEDSSIFSVTYRGRHTCVQTPHLLPGQAQKRPGHEQDQKKVKSQETYINFRSCKTEDSGTTRAAVLTRSPSFSFPTPPIAIPSIEKENKNHYGFPSMTPDNHFISSPFSSPSISGSNSVSSYAGVNNLEGGATEYDLGEFTSALDSPDLYFDFDFLDSNFQFDL